MKRTIITGFLATAMMLTSATNAMAQDEQISLLSGLEIGVYLLFGGKVYANAKYGFSPFFLHKKYDRQTILHRYRLSALISDCSKWSMK